MPIDRGFSTNFGAVIQEIQQLPNICDRFTHNGEPFFMELKCTMKPIFLVCMLLLNLVGMSSTLFSYRGSATTVPRVDGNFTQIFDGRSLDGWKMAGNGGFVIVEEDESMQTEGGTGVLWYTGKTYHNFVLKLDWMVSEQDDNSGVFVRFPDPGDDHHVAPRLGYEIQIDDKAGNILHQTGAIYDFAAPKEVAPKPAGQWNTMEIQAIGQSYIVIINDKKVTEFTGDRLTEGYIGLQAHDDESKVSFRNIKIKEI
jgi:hypothetical protein